MNKNTNSISIVYSHPELIKEWHPTKNADLKPSNYTSGSSKKVWWLCQKGHEWQATINNRTYKHSGCPICYRNRICPIEKSFYSVYPELMKEWDYEKNSDINPKTIRPSQRGIRVWWTCSEGHHWNTLLASRVYNKTGCPILVPPFFLSPRLLLGGGSPNRRVKKEKGTPPFGPPGSSV